MGGGMTGRPAGRVGLDRVRFVHHDRKLVAQILRQPPELLPLEMDPPLRISEGPECWIAQTFIHLRRAGFPVTFAARPSPNDINVLHYDDLPNWKKVPFWAFFVVVQADRARPVIADVRVVQNKLGIRDENRDRFIPLWSQAGLLTRDATRGDQLTTLSYFGLDYYLAAPFREPEFREQLASLGVSFEPHFRPAEWSDYRDVDAVLAVRNVTSFDLTIKPATKLVNAWKAGVIPFLGPEPAYRQIGRPGVDYVEVSNVEDVLERLRWMRERPAEVARMREEGARAMAGYRDEVLVREWIELFQGTATPAFEEWRRQGMLHHFLRYPSRFLAHRKEKAHFWANV
jgi:hypothetical protein